jgi:site-specific DNA recombinase
MGRREVAYLRVSTEAQTEKYGIDLQRQKIQDYCIKNNVIIEEWYIDGGYSGSKLERPAIQRLLEDAEKGTIATVYIYKLDRMSRDVIDTLTLLYKTLPKYGIKIVSMTEDIKLENPIDKVMVTVNAAMNQYEREVMRMRMSAGMVERVKQGKWMGGATIPYGYRYDRNDGILHIKEDEAENVREAFKMYLKGCSCAYISSILDFKGEKIVWQILRNNTYIGLIKYKGNVYKGLHKPIIDSDTYYRTQEYMKKRSVPNFEVHENLLTGLCYCGLCGSRMRYQKWGTYHKIVCYCSQRTAKPYMKMVDYCPNKVKAKPIETEVENVFKLFALKSKQYEVDETDNCVLIEKQIEKSNSKIKKMYSLYVDNGSDNLLELIQSEESHVKDLKEQLSVEQQKKQQERKNERIENIKSVSDVWDSLDTEDKNKALKTCVTKIVIKSQEDVEINFDI